MSSISLRLASLAVVAGALTVAGCNPVDLDLANPQTFPANGERGLATFVRDDGGECGFSPCQLDPHPTLMKGSRETFEIGSDQTYGWREGPSTDLPEGLSLVSSDESVVSLLSFTESPSCWCQTSWDCAPTDPGAHCSSTYLVEIAAAGAGSARLVLQRSDGSEYDAFALEVQPAKALAFHCLGEAADPYDPPGPVVTKLTLAHPCDFHVDAIGPHGEALMADDGFVITSGAPSVATVAGGLGFADAVATAIGNAIAQSLGATPKPAPVTEADGKVTPVGHGSTSIVVHGGGLVLTVPVDVP